MRPRNNMDSIGSSSTSANGMRGINRVALGTPGSRTPLMTRRSEKTAAAKKIQKWTRTTKDKTGKMLMQAMAEIKKRGRKRSDLHGDTSGFAFGSDHLRQLTEEHELAKHDGGSKLSVSDIRVGDHGSANILGSQRLYDRLKNTHVSNAKKKKSDIHNRFESAHTTVTNPRRSKTDVHGTGSNDGFCYGSVELSKITGAKHDASKINNSKRCLNMKKEFHEKRSPKVEPRGRRRGDFHGHPENFAMLGSTAAQERQMMEKMQNASRKVFGRQAHTTLLHGSQGGIAMGSESLQGMMSEHELNRKGGTMSPAKVKALQKKIDAANLIAQKWKARVAGETVRSAMQENMANMMLDIAAMNARREGKELSGVMGRMHRTHEAFLNGPGTNRSVASSTNSSVPVSSHHSDIPSVEIPQSHDQLTFDEIARTMTKAELRGVPGHHGKKSFNYSDGVSKVDQRFLFGSPTIAEGQIYENILAQGKQKAPRQKSDFGEASGKNIFGQNDSYKEYRGIGGKPRKLLRGDHTLSARKNSRSTPNLGQYGRKQAKDLRSQNGSCVPIGSDSLKSSIQTGPTTMRSNQFKDESGFLFGSNELMDRYRSNGIQNTATANHSKSSGITGAVAPVTPTIGDRNTRQYGFVDRLDGEARLAKKGNHDAAALPLPLEGSSEEFKFMHGSEMLRKFQNDPTRVPDKKSTLIHGSNDQANRLAFCSPGFNKQHQEYEAKIKNGPRFQKQNMLFSYEAPRKILTEKEIADANSKRWKPSPPRHNKSPNRIIVAAGRQAVCKNDQKLYGSGGFRGKEIDSSNFCSGFYESKDFRNSFSKETGVSGKAPY